MKAYEPGRFISTYESGNGRKIWAFLNEPENVARMETATYLSRPAAEPLSPHLFSKFGASVKEDRIKQMIGHMIRQILESRNYRVDRGNVRITTDGNIFSSATRYTLAA
jgi:hypothetical protein